jgi:hypothetical protein
VSTVAGSEDLHLLSTADAVGAGADLATTSVDINGSDRNALAATVWDIGAHQYASTASIGTSSRDYSTITLWEADLDDTTIYGAGANAVGECWNDAAFNESVTINGGATVGLGSLTLTAPSSERHDGTAGSGARNLCTASAVAIYKAHKFSVTTTIEWLEVTCDSASNNPHSGINIGHSTGTTVVQNNIVHDVKANNWYSGASGLNASYLSQCQFHNNVVYNIANENSGSSSSGGATGIGSSYNSTTTSIQNNTVHNTTTVVTGGTATGLRAADAAIHKVQNNIVTSSDDQDFSPATFSTATAEYNLSSDATASGTGSLTNKTSANQFVSTVGGSEDLHLKAGSDAIGAATDLAATPDGVQYDINGSNRNAVGATVWDIGAHQYASTASIGTSSRDYSTITLWEADLDDGTIYGAGANAVGECYNDSAFDESVTINGGGTAGLSSVTLTVAETERHDGTAGSGARNVSSSHRKISFLNPTCQVNELSWLEWDDNGGTLSTNDALVDLNTSNGPTVDLRSLILHGAISTHVYSHQLVRIRNRTESRLANLIVYDLENTSGSVYNKTVGISLGAPYDPQEVYNCTVHNMRATGGSASAGSGGVGFGFADDKEYSIRNCIATDCTASGGGIALCFQQSTVIAATLSNNLSSDATASGTGSLTNKTSANQFVSTVGGSEDLHLKSGADAIDAGVDLGAASGVQYDINGRDRDAEGDTWDIGAHEFVGDANGRHFLMFIF